jgi:uncharacterized membrane protein YfhO
VMLSVKSSTPGFLATSEVDYPGWNAFLDGSEVSIFMTNGAFRGVFVPAGDHIVSFHFAPGILYVGVALSALSMGLVLIVWRSKRLA